MIIVFSVKLKDISILPTIIFLYIDKIAKIS